MTRNNAADCRRGCQFATRLPCTVSAGLARRHREDGDTQLGRNYPRGGGLPYAVRGIEYRQLITEPFAEYSGEGGGHRGEAQYVRRAGQVGEGDEYRLDAAVGQQPVAADVIVGGASVVAPGEGGRGGPAA